VTVVVPARDEEVFIGPCLESILAQEGADLEVIVVDGASTDRTWDIVRRYTERDSRVKLLHNPHGVIPKSLNMALGVARGRWLVRVDAHSTIPPDYVRRAVEHLRTGRWGGVGGRKDGVGRRPAGRAIAAAMASRFGVGNSVYHYGTTVRAVDHIPFGAYPTELVRELEGWDERLAVNQDFEFDYRVGLSGRELLFDPAITISWHCRQNILDLFRQYRRYGREKPAVISLHPLSLRLRHLVPPALIVYLIGAFALLPWWPALFLLALSPYIAGLGLASVVAARTVPDWAARVHLPGAFVAMHVGWGIGFLEGLLRVAGTRRSRRR
jgi:glycosyltransferase involved in cell wall biosynthesis